MTILTKPSIKKTPLIHDTNGDEEVIEVHPSEPTWTPRKRSSAALLCMSLTAFLVAITGITCGLVLYRQYLRSNTIHRYKGFCSIPISPKQDSQLIESNHRVMPLRWTPVEPDSDVQVFSTFDEDTTDEFVNALREEFEIGNSVEKISVFDNGRRVNFIHDFDSNTTGIVDDDRCFVMDLDLDSVLSPDTLMVGMQQGGQFDVSRVHSSMHAIVPALRDLARIALLMEKCANKPTYQLKKNEGVVIRKRSLDAPPHDYVQFAGRHVQEIDIANLEDLLAHEQELANKANRIN